MAMHAHGLELQLSRDRYTLDGGSNGAREALAKHPRPTAFFAANDLAAIGDAHTADRCPSDPDPNRPNGYRCGGPRIFANAGKDLGTAVKTVRKRLVNASKRSLGAAISGLENVLSLFGAPIVRTQAAHSKRVDRVLPLSSGGRERRPGASNMAGLLASPFAPWA